MKKTGVICSGAAMLREPAVLVHIAGHRESPLKSAEPAIRSKLSFSLWPGYRQCHPAIKRQGHWQ